MPDQPSRIVRRRWLWLIVPFFGLPFVLRPLVPRVGDALARALLAMTPRPPLAASASGFDRPIDPATDRDWEDFGDLTAPPLSNSGQPSSRVPPPRAPSRADAGAPDAKARGSLFVSAATVRRALPIAAKTARGVSVVLPDGTRGIVLHGVRAGFEEGDVLTSVEGQPTPVPDAAITAVTGALAAHRTTLRGTILRRGKPIDVTVEVPIDSQ